MLRPLPEFEAPVLDAVGPKPYLAHQAMFDTGLSPWLALLLEVLECAATQRRRDRCDHRTGQRHHFATVGRPDLHPRRSVARVEDDATAFTGRSAAHDINIVASWLPDDPEPARHKALVRTWNALRPYAQGVYVNFMSDEPTSHLQLAYGDRKYGRLTSLQEANTTHQAPSASTRTSRQPTEADEQRSLRTDNRAVAYRRWLRVGRLDLVKINEIHGGDHVTDRGHLGDFGFATHGPRNRDCAVLAVRARPCLV